LRPSATHPGADDKPGARARNETGIALTGGRPLRPPISIYRE
jgi:hypothetical protein